MALQTYQYYSHYAQDDFNIVLTEKTMLNTE